jgi:hypothetical protein
LELIQYYELQYLKEFLLRVNYSIFNDEPEPDIILSPTFKSFGQYNAFHHLRSLLTQF